MRWKLSALLAVLCVVVLTVTGVALGLLISGPPGALVGAVPGALAAVLAGFIPSLRDSAERRHRVSEAWKMVGEPSYPAGDLGPSALLRPDKKIVEFIGRRDELAALRSWLGSEQTRSVRVIQGVGGVGKTRLALRLAEYWAECGHEWSLVAEGQEAKAVAAARGVASGAVLLILDYAETRAELEPLFRAVLDDAGPIRVLLLARSLGEWWDRLLEKSASAIGRLLTEAQPIHLAQKIEHEASDAELAEAAIPYFAEALRIPVPQHIEFESFRQKIPVLVLHAAALVAVLRFSEEPAAPLRLVVAAGILDELLVHEARYWRRTAATARLSEDGTVIKSVIAAASLLGAGSLTEAAELTTRVPELTDVSQAERRSWARWLYELYPEEKQGKLGSLQPDLLAETHVIRQLTEYPDLARTCLREVPEHQAEHALTILARAWDHHHGAQWIISEALMADVAHLAMPAARIAIRIRSEIGELLAKALQEGPVSLKTLTELMDAFPYPSVALAEAHLGRSAD